MIVPQEARVHTGVTESQCLPVNTHRPVLERPHKVVRRIHQCVQVGAVIPAHAVGRGDEYF